MSRIRLSSAALVLFPLLALAAVSHSIDSPQWTDHYDAYFKKYSKRYFGPNFDWRWFKAQGIAESNLEPKAKSDKHAHGIMQILPSTYEDIRKKNPHFARIDDPRWNIAAGIYYDRSLYRKWRESIPEKDRIPFTFASYNAGYGAIRKAYKKARQQGKPSHRWGAVAPLAPSQTRHYVKRISSLMRY